MRRPSRRSSHLTRDPRWHLRAPRQQSRLSGQSITSRILLAHRNARCRRNREEMSRLPGVRQQAARASIGTEDHTTRLAIRSVGARHGGSTQEIFTRGHTHLLVAVDKFTKWIEAVPITSSTASSAVVKESFIYIW